MHAVVNELSQVEQWVLDRVKDRMTKDRRLRKPLSIVISRPTWVWGSAWSAIIRLEKLGLIKYVNTGEPPDAFAGNYELQLTDKQNGNSD